MNNFDNEMRQLRAKSEREFQALKNAYNEGRITMGDYDEISKKFISEINDERINIIARRKVVIENELQGYDHKLRRNSNRQVYEELMQKKGDEVEKHYNTSLQFDDMGAARAAAVVALQQGNPGIVQDFIKRDPEFGLTMKAKAEFHNRYKSPEGIATDGFLYGSINAPNFKRERVADGFLANGQAVYRDRLR